MKMQYDEHIENFTNEATEKLNEYLHSVYETLSDSDLEDSEVVESIDELKSHILDYCAIRSGDNLVSSDVVKQAINKMGSPEEINNTFSKEMEFFDEVKEKTQSTTSDKYQIKVRDVLLFHQILSWMLTGFAIFILFNFPFEPLYGLTYLLSTGLIFLLSQHDSYQTNSVLNSKVRPSIHHLLTPLVLVLQVPLNQIFAAGQYNNIGVQFYIPLSIFLWIITFATKPGINYLKSQFDYIQAQIS